MADRYLAVLPNKVTGLFHGAVYANKRTPSGCDRWLLSLSETVGHAKAEEAARSINAAFPDLAPINAGLMGALDATIGIEVPAGSVLTLVTPVTPEALAENPVPWVERKVSGKAVRVALDVVAVDCMISLGRLVLDASSGDDPNLHHRYDHYVVAPLPVSLA